MGQIVRTWGAALAIVGLALAGGRASSEQSTPRLALEFVDYAQLPITGALDGVNTRGQLARVNFLRDEPGGRRFFVTDLNGPLYILDKQTKAFTTYLDFNGLGGRSGLFPKFTFERNFATGLINVVFDPDYARNGVFYTLHMEDPSTPGSASPRTGVVAGLDLSGYTTTTAIQTPTVNGQVDREVILVEWKDRTIANATFEGTAREMLRVQYPLAPHPLGEMTFNPVARAGDPDWRVMYLGAGDSQSGEQRDSRRLNPQRLDTLVGKILRIVPDLAEHDGGEHGQRERSLSHPERQPLRDIRGRPQRDLGLRPAKSSSAHLGCRSIQERAADAVRVQHRSHGVGIHCHRSQGRQLRISAAGRFSSDVVRRHDSCTRG